MVHAAGWRGRRASLMVNRRFAEAFSHGPTQGLPVVRRKIALIRGGRSGGERKQVPRLRRDRAMLPQHAQSGRDGAPGNYGA